MKTFFNSEFAELQNTFGILIQHLDSYIVNLFQEELQYACELLEFTPKEMVESMEGFIYKPSFNHLDI